jgi:hypothetical protein
MASVSGWRPGGTALPVLLVPAGAKLGLSDGDSWSEAKLGVLPDSSAALTVDTDGFIGSGSDPRLLGVRITTLSSRQ